MPRRVELLERIVRRHRCAIARIVIICIALFTASFAVPRALRFHSPAGMGISRPGLFVALVDGHMLVLGRAQGRYYARAFLSGWPLGSIHDPRMSGVHFSLGVVPCAWPLIALVLIGKRMPKLRRAIQLRDHVKAKLICASCGYDLTGLSRWCLCPECGTGR